MIWRLFTPLRPFFRFLLQHFFTLRVENCPENLRGPLILAPNHISLIDWCFLICLLPCKVRFVMRHDYFEPPLVGWLARNSEIIPICSAKVSRQILKDALQEIEAALDSGQVVCMFAEGRLSRDGKLGRLEPGIIRTARRFKVDIMPVGLHGLWPTVWGLGRRHGFWWRLVSPTTIRFGKALPSRTLTTRELTAHLATLMGEGDFCGNPGRD